MLYDVAFIHCITYSIRFGNVNNRRATSFAPSASIAARTRDTNLWWKKLAEIGSPTKPSARPLSENNMSERIIDYTAADENTASPHPHNENANELGYSSSNVLKQALRPRGQVL